MSTPGALLVISSLMASLSVVVVAMPDQCGASLRHRWGCLGVDRVDLVVLGRQHREHALFMSLSCAVGFVVPVAGLGAAQFVGLIGPTVAIPTAAAVVGGFVGIAIAVRSTLDRVRERRMALRHQLTAYVDVVTMLVAGDSGHEAALEEAAAVGQGQLFDELRRGLREQATRGGSPVEALEALADRFGLEELRQVAAAIGLAGSEGAPLVRSLSARGTSLRSALASEQELEARLRTSRLTGPTVGMALIFMVLVVYPALSIAP